MQKFNLNILKNSIFSFPLQNLLIFLTTAFQHQLATSPGPF